MSEWKGNFDRDSKILIVVKRKFLSKKIKWKGKGKGKSSRARSFGCFFFPKTNKIRYQKSPIPGRNGPVINIAVIFCPFTHFLRNDSVSFNSYKPITHSFIIIIFLSYHHCSSTVATIASIMAKVKPSTLSLFLLILSFISGFYLFS